MLLGMSIGKHSFHGLPYFCMADLAWENLLTQGIGKALGCGKIKSPTFILIAEHEGKIQLIHADLYNWIHICEAMRLISKITSLTAAFLWWSGLKDGTHHLKRYS